MAENVPHGDSAMFAEDDLDSEISTVNDEIPGVGPSGRFDMGFDDEEDTEEKQEISDSIPEPDRSPIQTPKPTLLNRFRTAFVSAVGYHDSEITTHDWRGKEIKKTIKSKELLELEGEKYASMKSSETQEKREGNFGQKVVTFFERVWKGTFTEKLHAIKEKHHGIELMATAGIDNAITAEFDNQIDKQARERIEAKRNTKTKKVLGGVKDFFQEFVGHERDLHREKMVITSEMRANYDNNPSNTNNPIYHLIHRDTEARESLARNVADSPIDFLHQGDKKTEGILIEKDSKVDKFLKEEILKEVVQDTISQCNQSQFTGEKGQISADLRNKLDQKLQNFFFSDDFAEWRKTLTPQQQTQFENSLTYANNVLSQAETTLMPNIRENLDHYRSAERLDFEIELVLGTAQFGPNGEIPSSTIFSKERVSQNQALFDKLRERIHANNGKATLFDESTMSKGLRREWVMAAMNSVATSEVAAAVGGLVAGKGIASALRTGMSWIPFVGSGLVAGGVSGAKEYGRLGKMRGQFGSEQAEGYEHPSSVNAVRAEALRKVDYHRIDLGHRIQQLTGMSEKLAQGENTPEDILQTLGYLADSRARISLSDKRHINLFHASKDTPEGRAIFQKQEDLHNQARVLAMTKLNSILGNTALRTQVAERIGIDPATVTDAGSFVNILAKSQIDNLEYGSTIPTAHQLALGALSIDKAKSIAVRDQAFQKWRWGQTGKRAAISGVTAGLMSWGISSFAESHEQIVQTGIDHQTITTVDHELPLHVAPVPTGEVLDPNTHEVLATMHAHIPEGTTLIADQAHPGTFDLIVTDDPNHILINDFTFGADGHINETPDILNQLTHNHIDIEHTELPTVTMGGHEAINSSGGIDYTQWNHSLTFEEMGGNPDTFIAHNLDDSFANNPEEAGLLPVERVTQINGIRNFWRGMENHVYEQQNAHINPIEGYVQKIHYVDTMWGKEILSAAQSNNVEMTNLPDLIATEEGNRRLAELINEAVRENVTGDTHYTFSDEAHRIAWEMSYWGDEARIPDADEVRTLLEYFNEIPGSTTEIVDGTTIIPHDIWFTMDQDLTQTVDIPYEHISSELVKDAAVGVGYARPLESVEFEKSKMEISIPKTPPFYFGYPNGGLESWKQYGAWLEKIGYFPPQIGSENIREVKREQDRIIEYLRKLNPDETIRLTDLSAQIPPMHPDCRVAINIPAYHEERGIYHTLEEWSHQNENGIPIDKNKYEINIIVNREETAKDDKTYDEVSRFKQEHPDIHVNLIKVVFPSGKGGVGPARKVITDLTLLRSSRRGLNQKDPLYIESEDADLLEIDAKAVSNLIKKFDSNPKLDALRGKQDLAPNILKEHDYLFFERRVERLTEYLLRDSRLRPEINPSADSRWNSVVLGGWNSAYTAEAYALIGGYQNVKIGEDVDLGTRFALMRGERKPDGTIIPNTKTIDTVRNIGQSNPRRFIQALLTKKHAYHTFGDEAIDQAVRDMEPVELLKSIEEGKRISEDNIKIFENVLNSNFQWLRNVIKDDRMLKITFSRLMTGLGFSKYKVEHSADGNVKRLSGSLSEKESEGWQLDYHQEPDGQIKIDNIDNLANALEKYRNGDKSNSWV
ncbi:MAG: hypothetical protein UX38_C0019G0002 [Microgenomates group bacterium GW2011_GWC1_46_16]|uniref:Uncharacterized protein n=2 Tax=Candidatus Collieribacteriota TaxID=1752725 RepID=A0A1F5F6Q0_9BACT|nr:MAG: hypothetical protein UX32_C0008G0032 [Microgenomates group bacterium GW2011_GWF1_46_12]KKU25675.1 MAG: hypothetical protein UX38_C0019G0002 [Microgenomates group bacterium GW2011_GWC1_46_16]KKU27661.1 MAG: hypothetical protein UX40_C0009G0032 [Microgenomates group bacterium GW2011_GWF2_46_18]KKU43385.1 MAG: hypothetical protein UX59_C0020G0003 [Microgenomates group bacterium GW2011_GWA1_46_7]KKU44755.1 MAG: hypothetical protein UX63_C0023G0003 [Microgenomates group bacterium GW2011_GWB1